MNKAICTAKFERYVGMDWSGAKSPLRSHAVAIATCYADDQLAPSFETDKLSRTDAFNYISELIESKQRCFVGIDCNFGYSLDVGKKQFGENAHFQDLWDTVEQTNADNPNFFAGAFWTHPKYSKYFWTQGKQPEWFSVERLRRYTEQLATQSGLGIPESPFKLIGAKQVGKGGLAGMRMVHRLKEEHGDKVAIWPYEAEKVDEARVVISELYPRLFIRHAGFGNSKIRELESLNAVLEHFSCLPIASDIEINDHLSDAIIAATGLRWFFQNHQALDTSYLPPQAIQFEGWIFGVGLPNEKHSVNLRAN